MTNKIISSVFFGALCSLLLAPSAVAQDRASHTFEIGKDDFLLDGKPFQIRCGEIHSPRVPREYWRHRLQMCKAMGLNTVCAYLFWNFHERTPGEFTWDGRADVAAFCQIAQEEGLWVILRPGPYACAEWEMGGLPWWLLKHRDIALRSRDPRFIQAARSYLKEVGKVLGPLQVTQGGPILMVQVENEYGFYAKDAEYMGEIRQALLDAGFDVPLFSCNPVQHLHHGHRDDLFPVVNFGSNPKNGFKALREILPHGPLMCGEYYSGWFDTWGNPHHTGNTGRYLSELEYMLKEGASFSIYMAHGGTSFGLWAGADRPFKPDTSCYDYDAPISEAGWVTDKFMRSRSLMSRYLLPGETLPELPTPPLSIKINEFELTERAALSSPEPSFQVESPGTYEEYDLARGGISYQTTLPAGPEAKLSAKAVHDFAWVRVDGELIGVLDRRKRKYTLDLPARDKEAKLEILVYALGRVNFGKEVHDRKGLHAPVVLEGKSKSSQELANWEITKFPMDAKMLSHLEYSSVDSEEMAGPGFYRGTFEVSPPGDTFLDMSKWGMGIVWVNGHCLGRFWSIGPSQTAFLPGVWLKEGKNEVVVFDLTGPSKLTLAGLGLPVMNRLQPHLDFGGKPRGGYKLNLKGTTPVAKGSFPPGDKLQLIEFPQVVSGRFVCLESLSAHGDQPYAAAAEIDLMDANGKPLSHEGWTIAYVDSEERESEDGTAENAIDGQTANHWHTEWANSKPKHPHQLVIDLGKTQRLSGFRYVPRSGYLGIGGRIKDYRIYVGKDLVLKK